MKNLIFILTPFFLFSVSLFSQSVEVKRCNTTFIVHYPTEKDTLIFSDVRIDLTILDEFNKLDEFGILKNSIVKVHFSVDHSSHVVMINDDNVFKSPVKECKFFDKYDNIIFKGIPASGFIYYKVNHILNFNTFNICSYYPLDIF